MNARRPFLNASRGGFTLIELIVVVMIVAIVAGLAITQIDFLVPKYRLRGAAREVGAAFKQARTRSAGTGKDVYIEMDLSRSRYWLLVAFPKEPREGEEAPERRELEYRHFYDKLLPDGVHFVDVIFSETERVEEGVARMRVSPFGSAVHTIVHLRNDDGRVIAVKLNGFTGSVLFYDGRKEADALVEDSDP